METSWYYTHHGKQQGPVELPELQRLAAAGTLHPRDLVWCEGMPQWTDAASVSEVFAGIPISPASDNAAAASTPGAPPLAYFAAPIGQVVYAGFWLRFAAYLIDYVIVLVACLVLAFAIGLLVALTGTGGSQNADETVGFIVELATIVVFWLYWALFESSAAQATLGKRMLGLKVTDLAGQRITFGRATGRFFGKILSGLTFTVGFIMAGFTEKKQALHDMLAGTLVVRASKR